MTMRKAVTLAMKVVCCGLVFAFLMLAPAEAKDLRAKYVGKSSCKSGLDKRPFGVRLDKTQNAFFEYHKVKGKALALIVQYPDEERECGTVRDIIQSVHADVFFAEQCLDPKDPAAIVIGTLKNRDRSVTAYPLESWRVDLKHLRFVEIRGKIRCDPPRSYAGDDDGSDLAGWAKERAQKLAN